MKKILMLAVLMLFGSGVFAETMYVESGVNMANFWEKNGKEQQKIIDVSSRIINANKLSKRVVVVMDKTPKTINAYAHSSDRSVHISQGLLPYLDNDDELAAVISHEIAHVLDFYEGFGKPLIMLFNSKAYEKKADLIGLDLMVKAGYNPVAMMTCDSKWMGESKWSFGIDKSHPVTSKRLMEQYKTIYRKYPQYLQSDMTKNLHYVNWYNTAKKDVNEFQREERQKALKRSKAL